MRVTLRDGRSVTLREVRADDADAMRATLEQLSPYTRHSRFMGSVAVTPALVERAVHSAARGERALVAVEDSDARVVIVGGARFVTGADPETCEFAVMIAEAWHGAGLASSLMKALIREASACGLARMEGYVLASNTPMLDLARRLGFTIGASEEGPSVKLVRLDLGSAEARYGRKPA